MLSEIETRCSTTAVVDNDPVTALTGPSEELGLFREWSTSEADSFFYIAMGISEPRVRARPRD
jgi:hypothetical protein